MAYHDKKFPILFTAKIDKARRDKLREKTKKLGISASEWFRQMIDS